MKPLVGITSDLVELNGTVRAAGGIAYANAVVEAGGTPVLLPPIVAVMTEHARHCDAFVFTGGDDPRTEPFGHPTHPMATPVREERQEYETALLRLLGADFPEKAVLGVCLGMQMMALVAGGRLDQCMADTRPDAARHWALDHAVAPVPAGAVPPGLRVAGGIVHSRHRQAVEDPGGLVVLARADDGVIEAIGDPVRRHYLGVQWHPERTADRGLGSGLFRELIKASRNS